MKKIWKNSLSLLALILLLSGVINIRYGNILKADKTEFLDIWGDGFKNYATVLYHVQHDSSYMHFYGMNYPYGEHVLFTDNQPIISNTLKFINNNITDISDSIKPVIHYSMFISLLLAGVFLFLIFQKLSLPPWYSIPVTIGLIFLSPQIPRLGGHFGLAHAFVIPLFIYLLMLFEEKNSWKLSILMGILVVLIAQIHFYFFGITAFLIAFYFFFRLLNDFNLDKIKLYGFHFFIQIIIPFILLKLWISIGNDVPDRPNAPTGFLTYRSELESILTYPKNSFFHWIDEFVIHVRRVNDEGKAFIGMVSVITFIVLLVKWIIGKFKQPFWAFSNDDNKTFLNTLFKTGVVLVLFAGGVPFIIPGLEGLVDYTGPLKQLRSIGRFAWAFYYIINILVFYYLYNLVKSEDKKRYFFLPLIIIIFFLFNDAANFSSNHQIKLWKMPEYGSDFKASKDYWFKNIDISKYQAILPLPYYHVGSENFGYQAKGGILKNSLISSIITGLPNMGVMMSRTSVGQTLNSLQLVSEPYRHPKILDDLPNKKPLLIVMDKEGFGKEPFRHYNIFLTKSTKLFENKTVGIYELPLHIFEELINEKKEQIKTELTTKKLYSTGTLLFTDSIPNYVYRNFDELNGSKQYFTKGSLEGNFTRDNSVFTGQLPIHKPGQKYIISTWVYVGEDRYPRTSCKLREYIPGNKKDLLQYKHLGMSFDMKTIDNGWGLFEFSFDVKNAASEIDISFQNSNSGNYPLWLDELLIRPAGTDVYMDNEHFIWKNNRHFEK